MFPVTTKSATRLLRAHPYNSPVWGHTTFEEDAFSGGELSDNTDVSINDELDMMF